jgi:hypothetical protein
VVIAALPVAAVEADFPFPCLIFAEIPTPNNTSHTDADKL